MRLLAVIVGAILVLCGIVGVIIGSLAKWVALVAACIELYQSAGILAALWAAFTGFFATIGVFIIGLLVIGVGGLMLVWGAE